MYEAVHILICRFIRNLRPDPCSRDTRQMYVCLPPGARRSDRAQDHLRGMVSVTAAYQLVCGGRWGVCHSSGVYTRRIRRFESTSALPALPRDLG